MGDAVRVTILCVAEDRLGFTLARDLFDRVRGDDGSTWEGLDTEKPYATWTSAKDRFRHMGLRLHARGERGYEFETRRALTLLARLPSPPQVVVLCRDTDNQPVREEMERAVASMAALPFAVLLAVAHRESEAWVVAGFEARDGREKRALRELQQALGFDPTREPHRLTSKSAADARDAKRVCEALLDGPALGERGEVCWRETSLEELRRHGAHTGLPEYLAAVERWDASTA